MINNLGFFLMNYFPSYIYFSAYTKKKQMYIRNNKNIKLNPFLGFGNISNRKIKYCFIIKENFEIFNPK